MNTFNRKCAAISVLVGAACIASSTVVSAQSLESQLDASLRFGLELDTEPDTTFGLNNYESRIRYSGTSAISSSTNAIGYLELRLDQNSGINATRHGWVGAEGNFGRITAGKQYRAYYDLISSKTDIANWGSCELQIACNRQDSVLKYSNDFGGLGISASANFDDNDSDDSLVDSLDGGVSFGSGDFKLGAALGYVAKEGNAKSGFGFGVGASMNLGSITLSTDLQYANKNLNAQLNQGSQKALTVFTVGGAFGNAYSILSVANSDNTPLYITGGYTFNLSNNSYIYTELQAREPDRDNQDAEVNIRGVFVYTFDGIRVSAN